LRIEFPLSSKETSFGRLSDPKIPVAVRGTSGVRVERFLLDTGADFALAPRWISRFVGLDWERLPQVAIRGVEQGGLSARLGRLPIRLAGRDIEVRCFFLDEPAKLFILGRADFLDHFVLTIDQPRRRIALDPVDA